MFLIRLIAIIITTPIVLYSINKVIDLSSKILYDYKTNVVILHLITNIVAPIYPLFKVRHDKWAILNYFSLIALLLGTLVYIIIKKRIYNREYLRKIYLPSLKVFIFLFITEVPLICIFYYLVRKWLFAFINGIIIMSSFCFVYARKNSQRVIINSFETKFKLGILSSNIKNMGDLKPGEVVKIEKTTADGYIIKNSKCNEYEIKKDDISEIIGEM